MPEQTTEQTAQQQLDFLHELVRTAQAADITSELLWYTDGERIHVSANVSDVFAWGGADAEEITPESLPVLVQAIADLRAIHRFDEIYAPELFAARLRGMRPQGAAYPKERTATQALFDACGPARERGLGNPRRPPTPEDWQQVQLAKDHADLREQAVLIHEAIQRIPAQPPDPDGGMCDPTPRQTTVRDAGSIDTWQERTDA